MRRMLTATLAASLVLAVASPAGAQESVTGTMAFHCTAKFPSWPGSSAATCGDDLTPAVGFIWLTGTANGTPYEVHGPAPAFVGLSFGEACVAGEPPLAGTGSGALRMQDVRSVYQGTVTTADVTVGFTFTRLGTAFLLTTTSWTVHLPGATARQQAPGGGAATFVPLLTVGNTCPDGGPLTALVDGAIATAL